MKQLNGVYPISGENLLALPVNRLGLVSKADHRPEEAGSCAFSVNDLDAMHRELDGRGMDLGVIGTQEWGSQTYRVFFLREAENGYCYCFSRPLEKLADGG